MNKDGIIEKLLEREYESYAGALGRLIASLQEIAPVVADDQDRGALDSMRNCLEEHAREFDELVGGLYADDGKDDGDEGRKLLDSVGMTSRYVNFWFRDVGALPRPLRGLIEDGVMKVTWGLVTKCLVSESVRLSGEGRGAKLVSKRPVMNDEDWEVLLVFSEPVHLKTAEGCATAKERWAVTWEDVASAMISHYENKGRK